MHKVVRRIMLICLIAMTAACTSGKKEAGKGQKKTTEPVVVTLYSGATEAYLEFDPAESGKPTGFLIYLTRLADFKPLDASALSLEFTGEGAQPFSVTAAKTERPGVYRAETTFPQPGEYQLALAITGANLKDRLVLPDIDVAAPGQAAAAHAHKEDGNEGDDHASEKEHGAEAAHKDEKHPAEHDGHDDHAKEAGHAGDAKHDDHADHDADEEAGHAAERVTVVHGEAGSYRFSKDQQWQVAFRVETPRQQALASGFNTMGELVPVTTAEAVVSAPLAGIVSISRPLPFLGQQVSKGQVITRIEPSLRLDGGMAQIVSEHAQAKSRLSLAKSEQERARRLFEAKIAPKKRLEEADAHLAAAQAAIAPLETALKQLQGGADHRITVRAPISGTVVEVSAVNGKGIEAGQPLVRIVNTATLWLKANVPAADAGKASQFAAAGTRFRITGVAGEFTPTRLVSSGSQIDPRTRTLPVLFEVNNRSGLLKAGMFADVTIRTGRAQQSLVLPKEALVEDEGRWFVFVQASGQGFDRREVKTGLEEGAAVQILEGLQLRDRVVTQGAYYVKQSGQSGAVDPHAGHGH